MSVEIKFRWVGYNKHLKQIHILNDLITQKILDRSYWSFFSLDNRTDIGNCKFISEDLWTGFQDKNEMDIYAHDLVKFNHKGEWVVCEIVWNEDNGMWCLKWSDGYINKWPFNAENMQIVGNIYVK